MDVGWAEWCPGMDGAGDCLGADWHGWRSDGLCGDLALMEVGVLCTDLESVELGWSQW